jgi:hypothetical protein
MRLKAAFEGKLQEYMQEEFATAERAVTLGVREATDGLKLSMRRQVTSAGLGQRMANTWRGDLYPRGQNSIRAAGMVYTRGRQDHGGVRERGGHSFKRRMVAGNPDTECAQAWCGRETDQSI